MKKTFALVLFVITFTLNGFSLSYSGNESPRISSEKGMIIIERINISKATLTVTDNTGKVIFTDMVKSNIEHFELSGLTEGTYTIELKNKKEISEYSVNVK